MLDSLLISLLLAAAVWFAVIEAPVLFGLYEPARALRRWLFSVTVSLVVLVFMMAVPDGGDESQYTERYKSLVREVSTYVAELNNANLALDDVFLHFEDFNLNFEDTTSTEKSELDKILNDFDNQLSHYENKAKLIEAQLANAETRGFIANQSYYQALQNVEVDTFNLLQGNLSKLNNLMATSNLDKNSDEWHNLQNEIEETNIAMQESVNTIEELNNKMRHKPREMASHC